MVPELLIWTAWWQIFPLTCHTERCPSSSLGTEEEPLVTYILVWNASYKPSQAAGIWAPEPASTTSRGPAAPTEFIDAVLSFSKISSVIWLDAYQSHRQNRSHFHRRKLNSDHTKYKDESMRKTKREEPWHPKSQKGDSFQVMLKHTMQIFPNPDLVKILSFSPSLCLYRDVVNF